jgi:undecaprenyl-diphosphatase
METLNRLDTDVFLALNGWHADWLDEAMYWISDREFWFPFYALLLIWLAWKFRWRAVGLVLALALTVALSDQVTSSLMKPFFLRLRPCHEPAIDQWVHVVWECGGAYGFSSSHAANSFGFAGLVYLLLPEYRRYSRFLFIWAFLISYSRIYVGAHYPLDVLTGAGVGTLMAILCANLYRFFTRKFNLQSV